MFQIKTNILVASYIDNGFAFYDIYAKKSQPYVIKVRGENVRDGLSNTALCHIDENSFSACVLNKITIMSSNPPYDTLFVLEGHDSAIASMRKIENRNILISDSQHKYVVSYSSGMLKKEDTVRIWLWKRKIV